LVASFNALQERVVNSEAELRKLTGELEIRVQEELSKNREKDLLLIQQSRLAAMAKWCTTSPTNGVSPSTH